MKNSVPILPVFILAAALLAAPAASRPLPSYPHALRCSGLTHAWFAEVEALRGKMIKRFDVALYWSLAASDVARRAGISAAQMEADFEGAAAKAESELAGGAAAKAARSEHSACVAEVPPAEERRPKAG